MSLTAAELKAVYSVDERPLDRSLAGLDSKVGRIRPPGVRIDGDDSGLQRAVGRSERGAGRMSAAFKGAGAAIAGFFALDAVKTFVGGTIDAASDLNETISKSNIIFGQNAKVIDQWAQGAAKNLGLSRQQALNFAAGFGDMFSQIGFAGDEAAKMSTAVVQMAADLGSFNNLPTADVADRISAAFRGEYDSLQALIPNINAARVEAEAMAMTGKKNADQLTAQEKAAAVLAIVNKDGARAMGDFARTSDGAANKSKILAAQWEDQKAKIGQQLLPVWTKFIGYLSDTALPALGKIGAWLRDDVGPAFQQVKDAIVPFFAALSSGSDTAGGSMGRVQEAVRNLVEFCTTSFQTLKDITADVVTIVTALWDAFGANMVRSFTTTLDNILLVLGGALDIIKGVLDLFIGIFTGDWSRAWDGIKSIVGGAWDVIHGIVGQAVNLIWTALSTLMTAAGAIVRAGWDGVKELTSRAWGGITGAVSSAFGNINNAIVTGVNTAVDWVRGLPGRALDALGDLSSKLYNAGKKLLQGFIDGITDKIGDVKDTLTGLTGKLTSWKGPPSRDALLLRGAGRSVIDGFIGGLESRYLAVRSSLQGLTRDLAMAPAIGVRMPAMAGGGGISGMGAGGAAGASGASFDAMVRADTINIVEGDANDVARQLVVAARTGSLG